MRIKKVDVNINGNKRLAQVRAKEFWKYAANEWWKLITPYTPMRTGTMSEQVEIRGEEGAGEIEYTAPYSHYLYKGELMVDSVTGSSYARAETKKVYAGKELSFYKGDGGEAGHPLASKEWDKAAAPTKKPELVDAMQDYVDSGRLNLGE